VARRGEAVLEITARAAFDVAGPHIGPGAALVVGLAGVPAGLAVGFGGHFEGAVIAARAVDRELAGLVARLDHPGAADAGGGIAGLDAGRHLALEPARRRMLRARIDEAPGAATRLAVAPRSATPQDRRSAPESSYNRRRADQSPLGPMTAA